MSVKATNWVWGLRLPPALKLILMALADEANDDGLCWPSVRTIARKACVSERTVRRALQDYGNSELLTVARRSRPDGSQTSNWYQLAVPGRCQCPPDNLSARPVRVSPARDEALSSHPMTQLCQAGVT